MSIFLAWYLMLETLRVKHQVVSNEDILIILLEYTPSENQVLVHCNDMWSIVDFFLYEQKSMHLSRLLDFLLHGRARPHTIIGLNDKNKIMNDYQLNTYLW